LALKTADRGLLEQALQQREVVRPSSLDGASVERIAHAVGSAAVQHLQRSIAEAIVRQLLPTPQTAHPSSPIPATSSMSLDHPAKFVLLEEFLVPQELDALLNFTLSHQAAFETTKVMQHGSPGGVIDYHHRRSRVLFNLEENYHVLTERIQFVLPWVCRRLDCPMFPVTRLEAQLTASNDGEFFKRHNDNTHDVLRTRELTFVYYFHREPKAFTGGELRIYDSRFEAGRFEAGRYIARDSYRTVAPAQNRMVFFSSHLMHEVMPVRCPSRLLAEALQDLAR
jgi:Rps23 Pro-64 3,4-dihydroxylase Tpa1-like proline 4-hydroxylase